MDSVRISVWYLPLVEFAGVATTAAVVGIGGWLVHQGEVSLGTVVAFVLLLTNLFEPVQQLSQLFNTVQASGASLNKLFGLLDTKTQVGERRGAVDLPPRGEVHVSDVSFTYGGESRWTMDGSCERWISRSHQGSGSHWSGRPARESRRHEARRPDVRPPARDDLVRRGRSP